MGQNQASLRLKIIKENVTEISEKIQNDKLTADDRSRTHSILIDYIKELKLILNNSLKPSKIQKVEKLIISTLQELATVEGNVRNFEPKFQAKSLQKLHEIDRNVKSLSANLSNTNLQMEKEAIYDYKKRISLIGNSDPVVEETKKEVMEIVEKTISEVESEEKLKLIEDKHYSCRIDLNRFVGVSESRCYKNHKEHLLKLKNEVGEVLDINEKVSHRKKYLLFNITNNIAALEKKVKENEETIRMKMVKEGMINTNMNQSSLEKVVYAYREFEQTYSQNYTQNDSGKVLKTLTDLRAKIDVKLKTEFQSVIDNSETAEDVSHLAKSENIPENFERIHEIEQSVIKLEEQISACKYRKHSFAYNTYKDKLEQFKSELASLFLCETNCDSFEKLFKYINNVLILLDENSTECKSTSGDALIDILSISTSVNELGRLIQNTNRIENYKSIKTDLLEHLNCLKNLRISAARSNVCDFRDYVMLQIESYLSNLENMKKSCGERKIRKPISEGILSF